jgi:hypothetical protein
MRGRIDQMLGKEKGGAVFTGNLHSLCSNLLFACRMVHHNTSVIDEQDSTDLILDYIAERKILTTRRNNFADQCYRLQHLLWQMAHGHPKELQTNRSMLSGSMVQQLCTQWGRPMTLAGLPATTEFSGISCVTTLPAEMMQFLLILTFGIILEPGAI